MKIKTKTLIRTAVLLITLVNQALIMLGKNPLPFAQEDVYSALSAGAAALASVWSWWKNNSFTSAAITADEYLNSLRGK